MNEIKTGVRRIADERLSQLNNGKSVLRDMILNSAGQLADAAAALVVNSIAEHFSPEGWEPKYWSALINKPYIERLTIAGALIAAQIDVIQARENEPANVVLHEYADSYTKKAIAEANPGGIFEKLHEVNSRRCRDAFAHDVQEWSSEQWALAAAGEMGEVCNALKKLIRGDLDATVKDIAFEIADVIIYLDLLATRLNIDLPSAVKEKFNLVSDKRGSNIKIS